MTGNIGAEFETNRSMGFVDRMASENRSHEYMNSVKKQFKPELISRLDEILIFNSKFSKEGLHKMISSILVEIQNSLIEKNIILNNLNETEDYLYGLISKDNTNARSVQKILKNNFELPLCKFIMANENISEISTKILDNSIVFI